jgi:uncharacterized protein (TIGR03435 family)
MTVSSFELALLVKATVVLLAALVLLRVMRNSSASARYVVAAAAFAILLALPIASAFMPTVAIELGVPAPPPASPTSAAAVAPIVQAGVAGEPAGTSAVDDTRGLRGTRRSADAVGIRPLPLLRALWLTGGLAFAAPILLTLWRARSLRVTALAWAPGDVLVRELATQAGTRRRVRVLRHDGVTAPMTCGLFRPVILLPWDASDWPEMDVRRALIHELEHVRRGDWLAHLLARVVCAVYWLHPLVWICWRRLHLDAERACDDAVLRQSEGETYAAQLVRLAERMSQSDGRPILAMAGSRDLATRVRSVLDADRRRDRAGARRIFGTAAAALVALAAIAPVRAVPGEAARDQVTRPVVLSAAPEPQRIQAPTRTVAPFQAANPGARRTLIQAPSEERFATATVRRGISPLPNGAYRASDMATVRRSLGMVTFNDNEFIVHGASIELLIKNAYGIAASGNGERRFTSIEGIPSWVERFDVEARPSRPIMRGREFPPAEVRSMLQKLLADRFQLVAYWEPRDRIVYELRRDGPLGPQLRPSAECPRGSCLPGCTPTASAEPPGRPPGDTRRLPAEIVARTAAQRAGTCNRSGFSGGQSFLEPARNT